MIGEIYLAKMSYFNAKGNKQDFKSRPILIIAMADASDCVVLPISTIPHSENINPEYDVKIDPEEYKQSVLKRTSYVRTNKQTIVEKGEISVKSICNLKTQYSDLYETILQKREKFNSEITKQSRS